MLLVIHEQHHQANYEQTSNYAAKSKRIVFNDYSTWGL